MRGEIMTALVALSLAIAGCSPKQELPEHRVTKTSLAPKSGQRVEVSAGAGISEDDCKNLIERYRSDGSPDGQVSVHKPSKILNGALAPWCVENFDGNGIRFNSTMF